MDISVVGSGYVGTTIAACFADFGHEVTAVDIDEAIVSEINNGKAPIHEPGLSGLISEHAEGRLMATTEYTDIQDTEVTFLALPTPANEDGSIDTSIIETGAERVGEVLASTDSHTVVVKSTVVPGTTQEVLAPKIKSEAGEAIDIGMNPEFLREGTAVQDFLEPDKVVFGTENRSARIELQKVFRPLIDEANPAVVKTGISEAEMIKYANNAFLASKISLINDIGNICKEFNIDAYEVADAIGLDNRIEAKFLRSGVGWGGSCFPKDVRAIINAASEQGYEPEMLQSAVNINELQPRRLVELLDKHVQLDGARIAVLGLAFKPGTDDIRNSRAIPVIDLLQQQGADPVGYDPVAVGNMTEQFPEIEYTRSAEEALTGADGAVVVTDWDEFATLTTEFSKMNQPVIVDGRRIIEPDDIAEEDAVYEGLTW